MENAVFYTEGVRHKWKQQSIVFSTSQGTKLMLILFVLYSICSRSNESVGFFLLFYRYKL